MLALLALSSAFGSDSIVGFSPWNGVEFGLNRNEATVGGRAAASLGVCHGLTLSGAVTAPVGIIGDASGSSPSGDGTYTGTAELAGISARSAVVASFAIVADGLDALSATKTDRTARATTETDEAKKQALQDTIDAITKLEKRHAAAKTKLASCLDVPLGNPADVYTAQAGVAALPLKATARDALARTDRSRSLKKFDDLKAEFTAIEKVKAAASSASESEVVDIQEKVGKALDYLEEVAAGGATTLATAEALSEDLWSTGGKFDLSHERVGGAGVGTQLKAEFVVAWQAEGRARLDFNLGANLTLAEGSDPTLGVPMKVGFEAFTKARKLKGLDGEEVPYLLYVSVQADGHLTAVSEVDFGLVASATTGFKSPDGGATLGLGLQLLVPSLDTDPEFAPIFLVSGVFGGTGEG